MNRDFSFTDLFWKTDEGWVRAFSTTGVLYTGKPPRDGKIEIAHVYDLRANGVRVFCAKEHRRHELKYMKRHSQLFSYDDD